MSKMVQSKFSEIYLFINLKSSNEVSKENISDYKTSRK